MSLCPKDEPRGLKNRNGSTDSRHRRLAARVAQLTCLIVCVLFSACEKQPAQPAEKSPGAKTLAEKSAPDLASLFPSSLPRLFAAAPDDAILVVGVQDMDRSDEWKATALGEAWNDPNLDIWRQQNWPRVKRIIEDKAGLTLDELKQVMNGDMALFLAVEASPRMGEEPKASFACLWQPERDADAAEAFLQKHLAARSPRIIVQRDGDLLAIGFQGASDGLAEAVERYRKASPSSIAPGSLCDRILRAADPKAFVHAWGDMGQAFALVAKAIEDFSPAAQAEGAAPAPVGALRALGLDALDYAYGAATFREKGLLFSSRLQCKGKRQGATAIAGRNARMRTLDLFPAATDNVSALRVAPMKDILALIRTVLGSLGKESELWVAKWDMALADAETFLGLRDFEAEFPALVGQEIAFSMNVGGLGMGVTATLAVELGDKEKFMACLRKAVESAGIAPSPATYEGVPYEFLIMPPLPLQLSYGVVGDFFVFSTFQNGFRNAVTAHKTGVTLASSEGFKEAMGRLDRAEGFALSYAKVSPALVGMAPMALSFLIPKVNQALAADFTPADIPNLQVFLDHQQPTVSLTWAEDDALAGQSYSTGAIGLDMSSAVPMAAILAAVAAPSLVNARGPSQARECQEGQQRIQGATQEYMLEHNTEKTPTWSDLIGEDKYLISTPTCPHNGAPIQIPKADEDAVCPNAISEHAVGAEMPAQESAAHRAPIAIGAADFEKAQTRSKVARVQTDMRTLSIALKAYYVDNDAYPLSAGEAPTAQSPIPDALRALTTPVAYITVLHTDPFGAAKDVRYRYYCPDGKGWILISPGPDKDYDLDPNLYDPAAPQPSESLVQFMFDATNGTTSSGDIFRYKE